MRELVYHWLLGCLVALAPLHAFGAWVTHDVRVDGTDAIFLAGRTDLTIPAITGDPDAFVLKRHDYITTEAAAGLIETLPPSISVQGGDVVNATSRATGQISIYPGFDAHQVGPDGGGAGIECYGLGEISGFHGRQAPLVGLFWNDTIPSGTTAPDTIDFLALGPDFPTLSPSLGQVFFVGDGFTDLGVSQEFIAPVGATRMFLGVADSWHYSDGPAGMYDDNDGHFNISLAVNSVPEPTTLAIWGTLGGLGLIASCRRRRDT